MTAKKTRYTLTAAIGNGQPGSTVELTEAQAASPLYASRITPIQGGASVTIDVDALREEIRDDLIAEMEKNVPLFLADAKAKGEKLIADGKQIKDDAEAKATKVVGDAQAEAVKLVDDAKAEAATILAKAEADAKVIAAKK